jgi:hypothetical protein
VFEKGRVSTLLADLGVAFAESIQAFLFWRLDDQWVDVDRPGTELAAIDAIGCRRPYFFVPGSRDTMVKVQLMSTSSSLTFSPSSGAFATCIVISKLLLPVA